MNWKQTTTIRFGAAYVLPILTLVLTACGGPSIQFDLSGVQPEKQLSLYNDAVDGCAMSGKWKGSRKSDEGHTEYLEASVDVIDVTAPNPVVRAALYFPGYACGIYDVCYNFFEGSYWLEPGRHIVLERPDKYGTPHIYLELDKSGRSMEFRYQAYYTKKMIVMRTKKVATNECGVPDALVESFKDYVQQQ